MKKETDMRLTFCNSSINEIREYGAHSHDEWEIIMPTKPMRTVVGNQSFDLLAADVIIIPPGVEHSGTSSEGFKDIFVRTTDLPYPATPFWVHDYDGVFETLFTTLCTFFTAKENGYKDVCDALLDTIITIINKNRAVNYRHPFVHDFKRIISENISNSDFSVTDAIIGAGYNPDYVRRCFLEDVGQTPHDYLIYLRLKNAKKRLKNEEYLTVETIASECGFNDQFYFSRLFKKHFGTSPRDYRKRV